MVVQVYCNIEHIRCKWGLHSTVARFQIGSWSISPRIYSHTLVPLRHLHTNAKPNFITAIDLCFKASHRSSKSVSSRKTLTIAPPKFVQRLITSPGDAVVVQRSRFLRWPSGPKRPRTCVQRCQHLTCVVRTEVSFAGAKNCPFLIALNI